jgi:hypothetical protein
MNGYMENNQEDWEVEFEKQFYSVYYPQGEEAYFLDNGLYSPPDYELGNKIKEFIRTTIKQEKQKQATEIAQKIVKSPISEYVLNESNREFTRGIAIAISEVLSIVKQYINPTE